MNIEKTIENVQNTCDSYSDPDLVATIISGDNLMGANNFEEITKYNIDPDDSYIERFLKIHENENIFVNMGMVSFIPILNECDIFSSEDFNVKLEKDEFEKYNQEKEKLFGILVKRNSDNYIIGLTDTCSCEVDSSFCELEKSEDELYLKILEIINSKIIN